MAAVRDIAIRRGNPLDKDCVLNRALYDYYGREVTFQLKVSRWLRLVRAGIRGLLIALWRQFFGWALIVNRRIGFLEINLGTKQRCAYTFVFLLIQGEAMCGYLK